jgi:hypothetical protein
MSRATRTDDALDRLPELAADLVRRQVAVIVANGLAAAATTRAVTATVCPGVGTLQRPGLKRVCTFEAWLAPPLYALAAALLTGPDAEESPLPPVDGRRCCMGIDGETAGYARVCEIGRLDRRSRNSRIASSNGP